MTTKTNNKKAIIIACIVLAVIAAAFAVIYTQCIAAPVGGSKEITVSIIHADETEKTEIINSDAEYLREALEEKNLILGTESDLGLYVLTVDGETVDEANQEWWNFTKQGEMLTTGVDMTPVTDGDHFEITFTVGW